MAGNPFHGDVSGKHHEGKAEPPLSLLGFRHKGGPTEALKRGVIALIPAASSTPRHHHIRARGGGETQIWPGHNSWIGYIFIVQKKAGRHQIRSLDLTAA